MWTGGAGDDPTNLVRRLADFREFGDLFLAPPPKWGARILSRPALPPLFPLLPSVREWNHRLNCIVTSWTAGAFAGFVVVICTMYWM